MDLGPLVLGSQSSGLTVVQLAGAYTMFNTGTFTTPHYYTEITDYQGNMILDNNKYINTTQAISADTAYIMNRMMWNVLHSRKGTAYGKAPDGEMDSVAKTGTTSNYKDYTFAGLTPYYVTAIWWGCDRPTEMDTLGTSTLITRMTSDVNQVQSGLNLFLRLFLRSPFVVLGAMVMAFTVNARAAMIFVVTIPLLSVVVFGVMVVTRPLYKTVQTRLDRVLGLTRENLMACGDGLNDRSMIEFAGVGVAMQNAEDAVKEVADYVTAADNNHDGVAEAIEKFILQ